jgi:hypothetical protein
MISVAFILDELTENIYDRKRKKKRLEQILQSAHGPV